MVKENNPRQQEHANDNKARIVEIVVKCTKFDPEAACQPKLVSDQAQLLNGAGLPDILYQTF